MAASRQPKKWFSSQPFRDQGSNTVTSHGRKRQSWSYDVNGPKKRATIRNWTPEEEFAIASYLVDKPYQGQAQETLMQYERRMQEDLQLVNCDQLQLKNKINAMRRKYESTSKWVQESGIQEDDPVNFRGVVKKLCHYYFLLELVYGKNGSEAASLSYARTNSAEAEALIEEDNSPITVLNIVHSVDDHLTDNDDSWSVKEVPTTSTQITVKEFDNHINEDQISRGSQPESELTNWSSLLNMRTEMRREWDKIKLLEHISLEEKKANLAHEAEVRWMYLQHEQEMKRIEFNQELELKRLALEEKKIQLEMMKLQAANPKFS